MPDQHLRSFGEEVIIRAITRAAFAANQEALDGVTSGLPATHPYIVSKLGIASTLHDVTNSIQDAFTTGKFPEVLPGAD